MVPSLVDVCRKADSCWEQSSCPPGPTHPQGRRSCPPVAPVWRRCPWKPRCEARVDVPLLLPLQGTAGPDPTTVYVDMRALRHDR